MPTKRKPNAKRGGGPKTKKTPEAINALEEALRLGCPISIACEHAGITGTTYFAWQAADPELANRFTRARSSGVVRSLGTIRSAAQTDWRAAESFLKLSRPESFNRKMADAEASVTVGNGEPVTFTLRLGDMDVNEG